MDTVEKGYCPFSSGAKQGHLAGTGRADQYRIGEEILLAWDASAKLSFKDGFEKTCWEQGFQYGYLLGAEGSNLQESTP